MISTNKQQTFSLLLLGLMTLATSCKPGALLVFDIDRPGRTALTLAGLGVVSGLVITGLVTAYDYWDQSCIAARSDDQVFSDAQDYYHKHNCYLPISKLVENYQVKNDEEQDRIAKKVIQELLRLQPNRTYPLLAHHYYIRETVLPELKKHIEWFNQRIKISNDDSYKKSAQELKNKIKNLRKNLITIDSVIVSSEPFSKEKLYKDLSYNLNNIHNLQRVQASCQLNR